jgi:hypothetical protein
VLARAPIHEPAAFPTPAIGCTLVVTPQEVTMTVLRSIPAPAEALLGSSALAHVVTRNRDGSPQVSVVWCGVKGDQVFFCAEGSTA